MDNQNTLPLNKRLCRLALALLILWLVVFVLAPLPFKYSERLRALKETAEAYGIHPGALYYSDVPTTDMARLRSGEAVRLSEQ